MPCTTIEFGEAQIEPGKPRYPLKDGSAPCERMNFSALSSSSLVVTPALAFEPSIRRQRTRMSPEAAICSICSGDLRRIIRYTLDLAPRLDRLGALEPNRRQGPLPLFADIVRRGGTVDPAQQALVVVEIDQRLGLLVVLREAVADPLGLVVVAGDQRAAVDVADAFLLRRVELDVEDVAVLLAGAAAAEAADHLVVVGVDEEHRGDRAAELGELILQRFGLQQRAR